MTPHLLPRSLCFTSEFPNPLHQHTAHSNHRCTSCCGKFCFSSQFAVKDLKFGRLFSTNFPS